MPEIGTSSIPSHSDKKVDSDNEAEITESHKVICNIVNDLSVHSNNEDAVMEELLNNSHSKSNNTDGCSIKSMDENENVQNRLPKLIIKRNVDQNCFVNDFTKTRSPAHDKNSSEFVITNHNENSGNRSTFKQKQPIMGKTALLKKANIDPDSLIIQGIILNKYEDVLNHYVHRMYKRRISRLSSSEDDYDDTLGSPTSNCSPSSVSSIGTPGSLPNTPNRFEFPDRESLYRGVPNRFRFLMSTDDINAETTAEEIDESSLVSSDLVNTVSITSVSEYDPKKFLENALGDVTNLSESGILKHSSPSANQPSTNANAAHQQCEHSIGSSNLSDLLSKAGSFCSSMKKNLTRRRMSMKTISLLEESIMNTQTKQILEDYKKELSIQNAIMFQVSKALNYCRSSKEFDSGIEHIEAEKILLVATITKEILINEINSIEFNTYQSNFDPRCSGEIHIQGLTFRLERNPSVVSQSTTEYFLAVLTCGKAVICSEVVEEQDNAIFIGKLFQFNNLLADFEVTLSIYSMTVKNRSQSNQDNLKCPSPKSIFKCSKDYKKYKLATTLYIEPLAFSLIGRCVITISDLSKINSSESESRLKLSCVPPHVPVSEDFALRLDYKFNLSVRVGGFLTVGTENGNVCTTWNRRWCVLESYTLKYWNYPSEEVAAPLGSIDLRYCLVRRISLANRSICARSKTLFMPVQQKSDIRNYLLCADNAADMYMWEKELNFVLQSLVIWNGMKC